MNIEERLRLQYDSLFRAVEFTKAADSKATPVLGLHTLLVSTLAVLSEPLFTVLGEEPWDVERIFVLVLLVIYVSLAVSALTLASRVFLPINPHTGKSLIYFQDIAAMRFEEFKEISVTLDTRSIEEQLIGQVFQVSKVASKKMYRVRWAFILTGPTGVLWLTLVAYLGIQ